MTRTLHIALLTLGDPGQLTGGYLYHRRMAELAPRHNSEIDFVSFPKLPFPLATLAAPAVLRRARIAGAQVLVLDSIAAAFLGPWLLAGGTGHGRAESRHYKVAGLPLLGILHQPPGGIDHGALRTSVQERLDRLAYRRCRLLVVASDALAAQLLGEGVSSDRLVVVPPGRDVARKPGAPPGDLRQGRRAAFLCVGNWIERKGIHCLLEAFTALPADSATLHLVGDDRAEPRYATRIRSRLAASDLAGRVVVHGPLPKEDVAALYQAADAFVLPSFKEPYGTVYGEAMAMGLPVVGWRTGNLPHLADDEREGLVLEPGDVVGLTLALRRLAEDEDLRRRLGEAARRRALDRPTWEQSAALFFGAIRKVVVNQESASLR